MKRSLSGVMICLLVGSLFTIIRQEVTIAQSNIIISLSTPYYGNETITAHFDHRYPTYDQWPNNTYTRTVRYDGVDSPSCEPVCYDGHDGTDFGMIYERVLAAASGIVTYADWHDPECHGPPASGEGCQLGLYIEITHDNGYVTRYGHLSSIAVEVGDEVSGGKIIGTSGNTGNSDGPHLHFGVLLNDTDVDPFGWEGGYPDPWLQHSGVTSLLLWSSGEWADEALPLPQYTTVIDVDDEDLDEFSAGCNVANSLDDCPYWHEQTGIGAWNDMWWTGTINAAESDYWAMWQPNIQVPGFYNILVHIPPDYATTWQANFRVRGADNVIHHTIVDQYGIDGIGVGIGLNLGTHFLSSESNLQSVWVDDNTGEAASLGRTLGIDKVSFFRQETGQVYLPIVINQ